MTDLVSFFLLIAYLAFLPSGNVGLCIMLTALVIKFLGTNNITRSIYLLLFGIKTFGMVSLTMGYPGIGGKVAFVLGMVIIVFNSNLSRTFFCIRKPLLLIVWIVAVLYLFYLYGPQAPYCTDKLVNTAINGIVLLITFYYLFNYRSVDWSHIGQLGVLSAFVCFAACVMISPEVKPYNVLDIGIMRLAYERDQDIFQIRNTLSFLASMGFVILYASSPDRALSKLNIVKLVIYLISAFIVLNWSGARLPLISIVIVCALMQLVRPLFRKRYLEFSVVIAVLFIVFITISLNRQIRFVSSVLDSSRTFSDRMSRGVNWYAGYDRFVEKPLLGHGLGGYYIKRVSYPGEGTYAHNLFLELLSETGIIGTVLIFSPLILWRRLFKNFSFSMRAQNGGAIFLLLVMLFLRSMVSFDLKASISLFSIIGVIAVFVSTPREKPRPILRR
ncbi:O-antigen ligase family protein [Candidatus Omnitrophota bacterium]